MRTGFRPATASYPAPLARFRVPPRRFCGIVGSSTERGRELSARTLESPIVVQGEPPPEPLVIGVLGGIASGKSAVAKLLAGERGVVLDADAMAREAMESAEVRFHLLTEFGGQVFGPDGAVDRKAVAERVFASPEARSRLEGWIHPRVRGKIRAGLEEARASGRTPVVLDVPLLLENDTGLENSGHGLAQRCDFLVFVAADAALRDRRAVERRSWSPGEVARREKTQMPLAQKESMARHVIHNEAGLEELEARVREVRRAEGLD